MIKVKALDPCVPWYCRNRSLYAAGAVQAVTTYVNNIALQVVHEQLEELVFSEPVQAFHQRVSNQVPVPAPPYSIAQQFLIFAPAAEVQRYNAVRQKVAQMRAHMQRQLDMVH